MVAIYSLIMFIQSSLLYSRVFIYRNVCVFYTFHSRFQYRSSFHLVLHQFFFVLFSFSSRFLSSSRSRFRERLPNHFRFRFSFVHENNTGSKILTGLPPSSFRFLKTFLFSLGCHAESASE